MMRIYYSLECYRKNAVDAVEDVHAEKDTDKLHTEVAGNGGKANGKMSMTSTHSASWLPSATATVVATMILFKWTHANTQTKAHRGAVKN